MQKTGTETGVAELPERRLSVDPLASAALAAKLPVYQPASYRAATLLQVSRTSLELSAQGTAPLYRQQLDATKQMMSAFDAVDGSSSGQAAAIDISPAGTRDGTSVAGAGLYRFLACWTL
jgi:hypothetical protein